MKTILVGDLHLKVRLILAIVSEKIEEIEKMCDFIHPDYHKQIGFIKDISAGAVTFAAVSSAAIVFIIYFPYVYEKLF